MTDVFATKFYGDNFTSYSEAFSQLAGLRSDRALYLFSQTVGLKGVGNLNDFIRTYMSESRDTERDFDDLVKHYEELSQIYNEIEKAQVFAGELLQVAKEESRWESAIEKLLHNFAPCLLVLPDLYQKVNKYGE